MAATALGLAGILAGCSGGTSLAGDGEAPDASTPPIPDAGETGFGDSTDPWVPGPDAVPNCYPAAGSSAFDLRVEPEGPYLDWAWLEVEPAGGADWTTVAVHNRIDLNRGGGWTDWYSATFPAGSDMWNDVVVRLAGQMNGRMLGRTSGEPPFNALAWVDPATGVERWPADAFPAEATDPVIVRDNLAYAVWPDPGAGDTKVIRWDGTAWAPVVPVLPYDRVKLVWADDSEVWAAGERGTVVSLEADGWRVHDLGTTGEIIALWGAGGDDVWASERDGPLHHWDGTAWSVLDWPNLAEGDADACVSPSGIYGIWGAGGTVYFHNAAEVVRWNGSSFDVIAWWPGRVDSPESGCVERTAIVRLEGRSADDVFLAAVKLGPHDVWGPFNPTTISCVTRPFIVHWDGHVWHWM